MSAWQVVGDWREVSADLGVVLEYGSLVRNPDNPVDAVLGPIHWNDGAARVRGEGRTKTFKGECAWSDAAREANDRRMKVVYAT